MSDTTDKSVGKLQKCLNSVGLLTVLLAVYACSFVPARMAILWLDHWKMIPYTPVNNALHTIYAPVLWMDDHIPVVTEAGEAVEKQTQPLLPH